MRENAIELRPGDVVQLDPEHHVAPRDGFFAGCFMTVTETKSWGAMGFVAMPGARGEMPGEAYYRARWAEMEFVGRAVWAPAPGDVVETSSA